MMQEYSIKYFKETYVLDICLNRLSEAILTNMQNVFYEEIRTKEDLYYISICSVKFFSTANSF